MTQLSRRAVLSGATASLAYATGLHAQDAKAPPTPPALSVYAADPQVADVALSPDGNRIALLSRKEEQRVLIDYNIARGESRQVILPEAKIRSIRWISSQHLLLLSSVTADLERFRGNRSEFDRAYVMDVDTGGLTSLFNKMAQFYNLIIGDLNIIREGDEYFITASNYLMDDIPILQLYRFDMKGRPQLMDRGDPHVIDWALTPAGAIVARARYERGNRLWSLQFNMGQDAKPVYDRASKAWAKDPSGGQRWQTVYTQTEALDVPSLIGLGRTDDTVIIYVNKGDKAGKYFEINASGVMSEPLGTEADNGTPLFHPTTRRFVGFARTDDWVSYNYTDPKMARIAELTQKALPGYKSKIYDFAEDPRKVVIYGESAKDSGSYYFVDFAAGGSVMVGENYPGIPAEWITQKQPLRYKASDGLEIPAFLTLPPFRDPKNLPLIVLPHGGPESRDRIGFDWEVQAYASRGYAVLQPNFRGSSGYGDDFVTAGYGQWGRKMQTDLSDGVRYLASQGIIDPKRVAIVGASYGGYAALAGAAIDTGVYRCAVSIAGVSDLKAMLDYSEQQTGYKSAAVLYWNRFMGDQQRLDEISPARLATNVTIPVMLIHGEDDTVVPVDQSRRMERALKNAGKTVEFVRLDGEDHWQSQSARRIEMAQSVLSFVQKHNPA